MQTLLPVWVLGIIAIVAAAVLGLSFAHRFASAPQGVACTAEAKLCPDGSYVGRTGPNCEFAACPGATTTATTTPGGGRGGILPYTSGIAGTVMLGPTCPVMRNPPDPACADKPYQTMVVIFRASDPVHAFTFTQSDTAGNFAVSLPPGEYRVGAGESSLPRCAQVPATVEAAGYTEVRISCDTGIR